MPIVSMDYTFITPYYGGMGWGGVGWVLGWGLSEEANVYFMSRHPFYTHVMCFNFTRILRIKV